MLLKLIGAKNLLAASGIKYVSHDTKGDIVEYDVGSGAGKALLELVNDNNIPYFSTVNELGGSLEDSTDEDATDEDSDAEDSDADVDEVVTTTDEVKKKTTIKVGGKKAEKSVSV